MKPPKESKTSNTFSDLNIGKEILKAIDELGFKTPTPIQEKVIPVLMNSGGDLIATAQTGTGKTCLLYTSDAADE